MNKKPGIYSHLKALLTKESPTSVLYRNLRRVVEKGKMLIFFVGQSVWRLTEFVHSAWRDTGLQSHTSEEAHRVRGKSHFPGRGTFCRNTASLWSLHSALHATWNHVLIHSVPCEATVNY